MRKIKKILINVRTGKKFLVKDLNDDFHTQFGIIPAEEFSKKEAKSSKGENFLVLEPAFSDLWEKLNRGPQIITLKDIGLILAKTGVNKNSKVVDAGGGSGALCSALANVCKEVTTYEINPEYYDLIQKNKQLLDITNLTIKQENVYQCISEKNLDLITLDLPEPWKVTLHAEKALRLGGHLVVYLPNLNQVKLFINSTKRTRIKVIETVELIKRNWKIDHQSMRPEFQMLGHTGFLVFCRKI